MKTNELEEALKNSPVVDVVLITDDDSVDPLRTTPIISGHNGFDWDSGKFLLKAQDQLKQFVDKFNRL